MNFFKKKTQYIVFFSLKLNIKLKNKKRRMKYEKNN